MERQEQTRHDWELGAEKLGRPRRRELGLGAGREDGHQGQRPARATSRPLWEKCTVGLGAEDLGAGEESCGPSARAHGWGGDKHPAARLEGAALGDRQAACVRG
jgi:hypothetical protein